MTEAQGGLFHSPPWLGAVAATYGFDPEALAVESSDGTLVAGVPYVQLRDGLGERARCGAFSDYCDPLTLDPAALEPLYAELVTTQVPTRLRLLHSELPIVGGDVRTEVTVVWHDTDLRPGRDELWRRLKSNSRQNIRKARTAGVTTRVGNSLADVRTFFELHVERRKTKYRLLPQPYAFFENIHAQFAPNDGIHVALAELDGEVIAGILLLEWGNTMYYKFNASLDHTVRPNDLLVWSSLEFAIERGKESFDFGVSDIDQPGLIRFKQKFASRERDVTTVFVGGPVQAIDPAFGRVLGALTGRLTRDDVDGRVTEDVGATLYRYFA